MTDHGKFMRAALEQARKSFKDEGGIPVGAVIVRNGEIVARGHNNPGPEGESDPARRDGLLPEPRPSAELSRPHPLHDPETPA